MTKPLFYVICTTCEARLGIHNENLIGQIVACPKCKSMVFVSRTEPERNVPDQASHFMPGSGGDVPVPSENLEVSEFPEDSRAVSAGVSSVLDNYSQIQESSFEETQESFSDNPEKGNGCEKKDGDVFPADTSFPDKLRAPSVPEKMSDKNSDGKTERRMAEGGASGIKKKNLPGPLLMKENQKSPDEVRGIKKEELLPEIDELDELLDNRALLTPAELFIRMVAVGIGIFVFLLLIGILWRQIFSGGPSAAEKEIARIEMGETFSQDVELGADNDSVSNSEKGTEGKGKTEKEEEVHEAVSGKFSEGVREAEGFPGKDSEYEKLGKEDFLESESSLFESDLVRGVYQEKDQKKLNELNILSEDNISQKESEREASSFLDGSATINENNSEKEVTQEDKKDKPRGSAAFSSRPEEAGFTSSFMDEVLGQMPGEFSTKYEITPKDVKTGGEEQKEEFPSENIIILQAPAVGEHLPEDMVVKLDFPILKFEANSTPLSSVLKMISQAGSISCKPDWRELKNIGILASSPVNFSMQNVSLRDILESSLQEFNLGYISHGKGLRIVGREVMELAQEAALNGEGLQKYQILVNDLVYTGRRTNSGQMSGQEMANYLKLFVKPASWVENGGLGKIEILSGGKLEIQQQYPQVAEEAELFCQRLRLARNMQLLDTEKEGMALSRRVKMIADDITVQTLWEQSKKIRRTPITCNLAGNMPLREALAYAAKEAGAKIILDEKVIQQVPASEVILDADVPGYDGKLKMPQNILEMPVNFDFLEMPFEEAIKEMLRRFSVLYYYPVSADTFMVTTREKTLKTYFVEFLPVGDILQNSAAASTFIEDMRNEIYPSSWKGQGGMGVIRFDVPSRCFIILQNPQTMNTIHVFLDAYRKQNK
ncbi:MAG: hypothetical protein Q4C96_10520 [Planctomycetia bacterium]|nr:hypothetical protein [Planctomycetia bacterium]